MAHITDKEVRDLEIKANEVRQTVIDSLAHTGKGGGGHTAGSLGMADIFTAFFFHILKYDPKNPEWEERDRFVLSNGHIAPLLYSVMAHAGFFPIEETRTLRHFGSRLQGHPERERLPGLETTSGPLGSGLSQASGMALALRMDKKDDQFVYCCMSDGEQQEGNTWEAVMFAAKYKLENLIGVIDYNNIQISGDVDEIMPLEPIVDKYKAFNWNVYDVDGHNIEEFVEAVEQAKKIHDAPTVIIARTIPGKGVKEIENDYRWHGVPPGSGPEDVWKKDEQAEKMMQELKEEYERLTKS